MFKEVGVRLQGIGKAYDFSPGNIEVNVGDAVIVETAKGQEYGLVASCSEELTNKSGKNDLKPVLRKATEEDEQTFAQNVLDEKEAYILCRDLIERHELNMDLVDASYSFDRQRLVFYFVADKRVDFRELVKDLASVFKRRIELRQIGVRDEARMKGGLGICGREFCCSSFLNEFIPVSVRMAKTQNLSMNPTKISGACSRLMCCLKYEHSAYQDVIKRAPKRGALVEYNSSVAKIIQVDLLREVAYLESDFSDDDMPAKLSFDDIKYVKSYKNT